MKISLALAVAFISLSLHAACRAQDKAELGKEPKPGEERIFDLGNGVKMTFCWIPPSNGKFKIGSPKAEQDYLVKSYFEGKRPEFLDRENEYEVAGVDGFWMAKYEMTQAQYVKLTGKKNPSYFCADGGGKDKVKQLNTDDFPVEQVSWEDAGDCLKSVKVPSGMKKIGLPSEVQWEWAVPWRAWERPGVLLWRRAERRQGEQRRHGTLRHRDQGGLQGAVDESRRVRNASAASVELVRHARQHV